MNHRLVLASGIVAPILHFLVTLCFLINIFREKPTTNFFTTRFNRICFAGSFCYIFLAIDPTTLLGICVQCTTFLWIAQGIILATALSTLLVMWIFSMVKIAESERHAQLKLHKMNLVQKAFLAIWALVQLCNWIASFSKNYRIVLGFRLWATAFVALTLSVIGIAVSKIAFGAIRNLKQSANNVKTQTAGFSGSTTKTHIINIIKRLFAFLGMVVVTLPILALQILKETNDLTRDNVNQEEILSENAYSKSAMTFLVATYFGVAINFAVFWFAVRLPWFNSKRNSKAAEICPSPRVNSEKLGVESAQGTDQPQEDKDKALETASSV